MSSSDESMQTGIAHHFVERPRPYGFTGGVKLSAFREGPEQHPPDGWYHCIFPDGTRKRLRPILANHEVRGYYANHGKHHYFGFPHKRRPHGADTDKPVQAGLVTFMIEDGQRFWRTVRETWVQSKGVWDEVHEFVRLVTVQAAESELPVVLVHRVTEAPGGNSSAMEELPINKFLEMYDVNDALSVTEAERRVMTWPRPTQRGPVRIPKGVPTPYAVSELMLLKCMIKFRRLHHMLQKRKFAPGGLGHKRLLESDTAKAMPAKPAKAPRLSSQEVMPIFAMLLPQPDGSFKGTFRFQNRVDREELSGPREEEMDTDDRMGD